MQIKTDFPRPIREIENLWITLADGTRLAGRLWLPVDAETHPVPALLEYLPYRKSDGTAIRDSIRHPYLAGHGYACLRVDMRGSGDSDGVLLDEYLKQEQDDALEVIAWLAAQPWCTGTVGMFGISWGGFNSLQVAARRPPALKAIITLGFTDDRYADDVHYLGGCLLALDMLPWASTMLEFDAAPPDPRWVGDRWREMWLTRLEGSPPFIEAWLTHQRRDSFWKHGSVGEEYAAIQVPVLAVGGWADGYTNSVPRLLEGLQSPCLGLIGPWAHNYPEAGNPGPAIGFLQESLRWWDHWLKGLDTGIMQEPRLRAYLQAGQPPRTTYPERPGRWVAEAQWPSPAIQPHKLFLCPGPSAGQLDGGLASSAPGEAPPKAALTVLGQQTAGSGTGSWCSYAHPGEAPEDQRADDGRALCFTSEPAAGPVDILGRPEVSLTVSADQPVAFVSVRLCDVAPDGASTLVTWGVLNLTHRESHEHPTPLVPAQRYTVSVPLKMIGYTLPAGHCWRVAVSPTHWPMIWPSPRPVQLTVHTGPDSALSLPVRAPQPDDKAFKPFGPAEAAARLRLDVMRPASDRRTRRTEIAAGRTEVEIVVDDGHYRFVETGMETAEVNTDTYIIVDGDPLSCEVRCQRELIYKRGDWSVRIETRSTLTADATHFHTTNAVEAYEGEAQVFAKSRSLSVPRDLV